MRGMNSESVDLIYLDPPFNSNKNYAAPIGSEAAGAAFKDTWTLDDVDEAWHGEIADRDPTLYAIIDAAGYAHGKGMKSYLIMMAVRLMEMRRLLKSTGAIYLHCDPTASHYLKTLMDAVFGTGSFRNEIVWRRNSSHNDATAFGRVGDRLLFYGTRIRRNSCRVPLADANVSSKYRHKDHRGLYRTGDLTGPGVSEGEAGEAWRDWNPTDIGRCWSVPRTGDYAAWIEENMIPGYRAEQSLLARLDMLDQAGLIAFTSKGTPELKRYLAASPGQVPSDIWTDIPPVNSQAKERVGYPTQKPIALLERIINASSDKGQVILDPFCGCATACVAAEKLGRQWVGIDLSSKAADLVKLRLRKEMGLFYDVRHRLDLPRRLDQGKVPNYKTHKHTLFGIQEGLCAGCRMAFPFRNMTIDHVVPQSKSGTDHLTNLQLLCGACNSMKGTRSQEEFIAVLVREGLRQQGSRT
ncbi:MAG: DNA methyltransferase [Deltaproteobacteria bacterium]|nr:DNA methyltransferase [Deltaproteobacteria bacterium]